MLLLLFPAGQRLLPLIPWHQQLHYGGMSLDSVGISDFPGTSLDCESAPGSRGLLLIEIPSLSSSEVSALDKVPDSEGAFTSGLYTGGVFFNSEGFSGALGMSLDCESVSGL